MSKGLTLKSTLMTITGILVVLIVSISLRNGLGALRQLDEAGRISESQSVSDLFAKSALALAEERDFTLAALNGWDPIKDVKLKDLKRYRSEFSENLNDALNRSSFDGKDAQVGKEKFSAHIEKFELAQHQVDKDLVVGRGSRSVSFKRSWPKTVNALIAEIGTIGRLVRHRPESVGTRITEATKLRAALWQVLDYTGRERGIIGAAAASLKKISFKGHSDLKTYAALVKTAWQNAKLYERNSYGDERTKEIIADADNALFGEFAKIRKGLIQKGRKSGSYGMTADQWQETAATAVSPVKDAYFAAGQAIVQAADNTAATARTNLYIEILITTAAILIGAGAFWVINSRVVKPLQNISSSMERLVDGNLYITLPKVGRQDEIAQMAKSVEVFRDNAERIKKLEIRQTEDREKAEVEKRDSLNLLADEFEQSISGFVETVLTASGNMKSTANGMLSTLGTTNDKSREVSASSEQASKNVESVSQAADELSSSISEIGQQAGHANKVVTDAGERIRTTIGQMEHLVKTSQDVGEITNMITDIADQTNLLALNATIESARAGEAGKGFAVVAGEVKNLASETSKATESINSHVQEIQLATQSAANSIEEIGSVISEVENIATMIAGAVEQQASATEGIAANVAEVSDRTRYVSSNIEDVSAAVQTTEGTAKSVFDLSEELNNQAEILKKQSHAFGQRIRTA
jgi:methyl-accepting chemotaxis protein